jgi:hypothetical protein
MKNLKLITALLFSFLLISCATPSVQNYQKNSPKLDLEVFFKGTVDAWGMFQDRKGEVIKRFHVVIKSHYEGSTFILDEQFTYDDGTLQKRIWRLQKQNDGTWIGNADDVVGNAIGEISGNALHWRYVLDLPVGSSNYHMKMDDWMFLMDENTLINRTQMSKFGVDLGEVTLFFKRR